MAFDYKIRAIRKYGLSFEITPGCMEQNQISIQEAVFSLTERMLGARVSDYARPYSHWGVITASANEFILFANDLNQLAKKLQFARSLVDVPDISFLFDDQKKHFRQNFSREKKRASRYLDELAKWIIDRSEKVDYFTIHGV